MCQSQLFQNSKLIKDLRQSREHVKKNCWIWVRIGSFVASEPILFSPPSAAPWAPQHLSSLENQQAQTHDSIQQRGSYQRSKMVVGTPPKPHSQKFSFLSFTAVPWKMPLLCWSSFDLTQSMPSASNLFPRWHLSKSNRTNCLALHLPDTVVRVGANNKLTKQKAGEFQNKKLGNKISTEWFWKDPIFSWKSKKLRSWIVLYVCSWMSVCAQEKPEIVLSFHCWLIFKPCTNRKWRLRQSCKLPTHYRHAPSCAKILDKTWETHWFQAFKEIIIWSLGVL